MRSFCFFRTEEVCAIPISKQCMRRGYDLEILVVAPPKCYSPPHLVFECNHCSFQNIGVDIAVQICFHFHKVKQYKYVVLELKSISERLQGH